MVSDIDYSLYNPYFLLGLVSVLVFCPFSNWVVSVFAVKLRVFLISLGHKVFVRSVIRKYAFPARGCPFNLLAEFLAEQKFLILVKNNLLILFMGCTFGIRSKNSLLSSR